MKPEFEDLDLGQKSVTITISTPSVLQNTDCANLKLDSIKYAIREVQRNRDDGQSTVSKFIDFKGDTSTPASPTPQSYHKIVDKLKPGKTYKLKLRADYNTGDTVESEEIVCTTKAGMLYTIMYLDGCT